MQKAAEKKLERHLPEVRFDHTSLDDSIAFLRDYADSNIYPDWAALSAVGIKRDAVISYDKKDVAFGQCVADILHNAGGTQTAVVGVVGNVILISTADGLKTMKEETETVADGIDDAKVRTQLAKSSPDLKFDAVSFSDGIDFLRDLTSTNLYVDWPALAAIGVDRNVPITFRLHDVPFQQVIVLILHSIGSREALQMRVIGNVIVLSTAGGMKALRQEVESVPLKVDSAQLQDRLDKRDPEIKFDGIPASNVIHFLHDITGTDISVDWPNLEAAGISRNTPITLRLRDVPLREVIGLILDQLSTPKAIAVVSVDGGAINISAKALP